MKTHTNNYKTNIAEFGKEIDSIVTFTIDGTTTTLTAEELNSITPHYEGALLKSVMKQLDIDSSVEIPVGTKLNYKFGVLVGTEYEYIDFGNYIVYESEYNEDTESYSIVCYDYLLNSMVEYSRLNIVYPITIKDYLKAICKRIDLEFKESNFANASKLIYSEKFLYEDGSSLGYTYRDVLDQLAQVTGSMICIDKDNKLEVRYITNTNDTINEDYLSDINVKFGKKYGPVNSLVFSRAEDSDSIYLDNQESISLNGLCEIKLSDNEILNDDNRGIYLQELFSVLNGLEYYVCDYTSPGITYYELGDRYNVSIEDRTYSCVMLNNEINVTQGLNESIYALMPNETETDYTKSDKEDNKIRKTSLIVDKANGQIQALVSNFSDLTGVNYSEIGYVEYLGVLSGEPKYINIHPIQENIAYIYPSSGLFPQDSLYPRQRLLRFTNKTDGKVIDYTIPDDLLRYDSSIYDEFVLDSETNKCYIIKRCSLNNNEEVEVLENEITTYYDYPTFNLTGGDYRIEIVGYESGYIKTTILATNNIANTYATKTELKITDDKATITAEKVGTIESDMNASSTAKGNPIEIQNSGGYDLSNIKIYGKSFQSITPSTSEPVEIKNVYGYKFDNQDRKGYFLETRVKDKDNNTVSSFINLNKKNLISYDNFELGKWWNGTSDTKVASIIKFEVEPNTTYSVNIQKGPKLERTFVMAYEDENYTNSRTISNASYSFTGSLMITFTTGENEKYISIQATYFSDVTEDILKTCQFNLFQSTDALTYYELCKVGNDPEYYEKGILHKNTRRIESYNGETITTPYISTTGELSTGAIVYYKVEPYEIEVEVEPKTITLYEGYNKISVESYVEPSVEIEYLTDSKLNKEFSSRAEFTVVANEIDSKVSQDDIIADLNVAIRDGKGVITLTGNEVVIDSDNFKVDGEGNLKCTNAEMDSANIIGGEIKLTHNQSVPKFTIDGKGHATSAITETCNYFSDGIQVLSNGNSYIDTYLTEYDGSTGYVGSLKLVSDPTNSYLVVGGDMLNYRATGYGNVRILKNTSNEMSVEVFGGGKYTYVKNTGIITPTVQQTSLESEKKNFEKYENALEEINKIDIYKYNLNNEEDNCKKHLGFVIGDNFKYSQDITSNDNNGVDIYSFISLCCKAIQEQQEQIKELQNKVKEIQNERR